MQLDELAADLEAVRATPPPIPDDPLAADLATVRALPADPLAADLAAVQPSAFSPAAIRPLASHGGAAPVNARPPVMAAAGFTDPASVKITTPLPTGPSGIPPTMKVEGLPGSNDPNVRTSTPIGSPDGLVTAMRSLLAMPTRTHADDVRLAELGNALALTMAPQPPVKPHPEAVIGPPKAHIGPEIPPNPYATDTSPLTNIVGAVGRLASGLARPAVLPLDPHVTPAAPTDAADKSSVSDIIENVGRATEPLVTFSAGVAPLSTAAGLAATAGASHAVAQGVTKVGGSPEDARLAGNVAGTIVGAVAAGKVHEAITEGGAAARAAKAGRPPEAPTGPENAVPVGSGRTEAAAPGGLPEPRAGLPAAPEPPVPSSQVPTPAGVAPAGESPAAPSEVPTEAIIAELATLSPADTAGYHAIQTGLAELERRGISAEQAQQLVTAHLAQPAAAAPPDELAADLEQVRQPEALDRIAAKLANGETPGTPEARAAYEEQQRVNQVREAAAATPAADTLEQDLATVRGEIRPNAEAAPAVPSEALPAAAAAPGPDAGSAPALVAPVAAASVVPPNVVAAADRFQRVLREPFTMDTRHIKGELERLTQASETRSLTPNEQRYRERLQQEIEPLPALGAHPSDARFTALEQTTTRTRAEAVEHAILTERYTDIAHQEPTQAELQQLYDAHAGDTPLDRYLRRRIRITAHELGLDPIDPIAGLEPVTLPKGAADEIPTRPTAQGPGADEPGALPRAGAAPHAPAAAAEEGRIEADPPESENEALDTLVGHARAAGWTGDHVALRHALADRLQFIKDFDAEYAQLGRNPKVLLKEIARLGGISVEADTTHTGEVRWLQEFQDRTGGTASKPRTSFGMVAGVQGVFKKGGRSLDDLLTSLQRNSGQFPHLQTVNDLIDEIAAAASAEDPATLLKRFRDSLGPDWWTGIHAPAADEGDISFNPDELEAAPPSADTLDTGETQTRLPGAEGARQVGQADTTFRAPVQATGDDFAQKFLREHDEPEPETGTLFSRSMFDDAPRSRKPGPPVSPKASRPPVAQGNVVPGVQPFLERDVIPTLAEMADQAYQVRGDLVALFSPSSVGPAAARGAAVLRSQLAARSQRQQRAQRIFADLEKAFDRAPRDLQVAFAEAVDEGDIQRLKGQVVTITKGLPLRRQKELLSLVDVARTLNTVTNKKRDETMRRGILKTYLQHYFPREWVQPGRVRELVQRILYRRRPLQGSKAFTKRRSINDDTGKQFTFAEMLERGFEPVSWNPVTAYLRKWIEMDKAIVGHDILAELKRRKLARLVPAGKLAPKDWIRFDESFGAVYGPPFIQTREGYDEQLMAALERFADDLGVTHTRATKIGHEPAWGWAKGDREMASKANGPETVIMHELGHILDHRYGFWDIVVSPAARAPYTFKKGKQKGRTVVRAVKEDAATKKRRTAVKQELRALADLRYEGHEEQVSDYYKQYVREQSEQMANLVHAFIWNPERAKTLAPTAYWAVFNLTKAHPELMPLRELQQIRSLVLGTREHKVDLPGPTVIGHYYGPREVVRLLHNHLSPGLRGKFAFDTYRRFGNLMNQVQLGFSFFHLTMIGLETVVSKQAQTLQLLSRGQLGPAARHQLEVPVAWATDFWRGHQALKAFYARDASAQTLTDALDQIIAAGGGVGWDKFQHDDAPAHVMQALRATVAEAKAGNYPGAAARSAAAAFWSVPAVIEMAMKPIMEGFVPRVKLGAFLDHAAMELQTLGAEPSLPEVQRVLGQLWDSMDNRFGQLRYDNLFWHNVLKDAAMASVRAVGWNVGTLREVYGAPTAQLANLGLLPGAAGGGGGGRRPTRLVNTGVGPEGEPRYEHVPEPWLHRKFAYVIALFFIAAVTGALLQYAMTGERPDTLRDYFFPRTGRRRPDGTEERKSIPSYFKDVYHGLRDFPGSFFEMLLDKEHPAMDVLQRTLENEDFFGVEIRNEKDPLTEEARQVFDYMLKQWKPMTVSNLERTRRTFGAIRPTDVALQLFGITDAPATVSRTEAEAVLHKLQKRRGLPSLTQEQGAARDARRDVRRDTQRNPATGVQTAREAVAEGTLRPRQAVQAVKQAGLSYLQRGVRSLTLEDALDVYEAATPAERVTLQAILSTKIQNADAPPAKRAALLERIRRDIALPATKAAAPVRGR